MTQQYLRQISLVVADATGNGFDFSTFWVSFNVRRGDNQTPNSLDVRIYNVKPETINLISQNEFSRVSLSAGYPDNTGLLFQGNIKQFRSGRVNQLDSYVDITAADSDQAYNYAYVSQTVPNPGPKPSSIAAAIQGSLAKFSGPQAITKGYAPIFVPNTCVRGRVLYGMARDEARDFAAQNNCKWSLQDGALTFIPWNSYIPSGDVPNISVSTGLLGVPEQTQQGIEIQTLLNPTYKVGQLIKLDSNINKFRFGLDSTSQINNLALSLQNQTNQQGLYYVMVANHSGDTRGEDWTTHMTCLSVDATLVDKEQANALYFTLPSESVIQRYGGT
jgi:hypothetical protein